MGDFEIRKKNIVIAFTLLMILILAAHVTYSEEVIRVGLYPYGSFDLVRT